MFRRVGAHFNSFIPLWTYILEEACYWWNTVRHKIDFLKKKLWNFRKFHILKKILETLKIFFSEKSLKHVIALEFLIFNFSRNRLTKNFLHTNGKPQDQFKKKKWQKKICGKFLKIEHVRGVRPGKVISIFFSFYVIFFTLNSCWCGILGARP